MEEYKNLLKEQLALVLNGFSFESVEEMNAFERRFFIQEIDRIHKEAETKSTEKSPEAVFGAGKYSR